MKTNIKDQSTRLAFFEDLYENAKLAVSERLSELDKYMRQYKGSLEIDGSTTEALTVRNITYEIIESQISSDIPTSKIDPYTYSERQSKNAHTAERLCSAVHSHLPFDKMNDLDERYTYIYGGSVWLVEWNNAVRVGNELGGVEVHCISPKNFIPEPGINEIDDMEYCFLRFTSTRSELMRRYDVSEEDSALLECEYSYGDGGEDSDAVSVIICFYKDELGEIGRYVFSGKVELSYISSYYKRKTRICKKCHLAEGICSCEAPTFEKENQLFELVDKDTLSRHGKKSDKSVLVPYFTPKHFPIVIRKNTSTEDSVLGQSDCEFIRPEQQAINKVESRILQKLLRSGITPVMPEDASVSLGNSVFGQVIKMKPGESLGQYGKIDTTPNISQDIEEADRLYDHAKRTLGISDAYQGIDTSLNESGVAKRLRISQANSRLESKRRMKYAAYADIDRLIFEHYLAFADEPREMSYKDAYGEVHSETFCRYDFLEYNEGLGEFYYDDAYLFTVDLNDGSEYQREALWERNLSNLTSGTLGDPASPITLLRYWQSQERAHYPYARENVEYFQSIVKEKNDHQNNKGEENAKEEEHSRSVLGIQKS
ncbi:MAG: hypothetical protein IKB38_08690 [Clostridia bacterium]|nr:hypothetical protein [Clostridia bacterium]